MDVEWLILADAAQVVGGKLYVLGGGWDRLSVPKVPSQYGAGIAASVSVPWSDTNKRHTLQIEMITEDGQSLARVQADFDVGRPLSVVPGQDQRFQVAFGINLEIRKLGTYAIIARLNGVESKRVNFYVSSTPAPTQKPAGA